MASFNRDGICLFIKLSLLVLFCQLASCISLAKELNSKQKHVFPIRLPSQDEGSFSHLNEQGYSHLPNVILRRQRRGELNRNEDFVSATQSERKLNAIVHLKQAVNVLGGLEKVFLESGCNPENIRLILKAILDAEKTAEMTKMKEAWTLARNARAPIQICYENLLQENENHQTNLVKLANALRSSSIHITLALVYLSREDPNLFANDLDDEDSQIEEADEIDAVNEIDDWSPDFIKDDDKKGYWENEPFVRRGVILETDAYERWEEENE